MRARQQLLLVLATAAAACARGDAGRAGVATPLFAWSSGSLFGDAGRSVLEAGADLATLLADLVEGVARPDAIVQGSAAARLLGGGPRTAGDAPEVVLVLLGSELRTSHLRRSSVAPLQDLVGAAASSVAMPYIMHAAEEEPPALSDLREAIASRLPGGLETAGCGEGRPLSEAAALLAAAGASAGPRVVLGCTSAAAAGGAAPGTPEAVAEELRQVRAAHDAAAALGRRQATVYAVRPAGVSAGGAAVAARRRQLMASGGAAAYTTCDAVCRTQVKWLEGMLGLLLIVVGALAGLTCLGALDTPTRFESPKDGSRGD